MSHSRVVALAIRGPHLLHTVKGRLLSLSISPLTLQHLVSVPPLLLPFSWRIHGSIRSNAGSTRRPTHVIAGMDFSWPLAVPLLLHNPDSVSMVIDPVDVSHLSQMRGSVTVAGLPVQLPGSSNLLWGGFWWFGSRCSLFLLGCTPSSIPLQNFIFVPYVPLVFTLFCQVWIFVGQPEHN